MANNGLYTHLTHERSISNGDGDGAVRCEQTLIKIYATNRSDYDTETT